MILTGIFLNFNYTFTAFYSIFTECLTAAMLSLNVESYNQVCTNTMSSRLASLLAKTLHTVQPG